MHSLYLCFDKFNVPMIAYIKRSSPLLDFLLCLPQYSIDVQSIEKIVMVT